jgi:hypothetical protein
MIPPTTASRPPSLTAPILPTSATAAVPKKKDIDPIAAVLLILPPSPPSLPPLIIATRQQRPQRPLTASSEIPTTSTPRPPSTPTTTTSTTPTVPNRAPHHSRCSSRMDNSTRSMPLPDRSGCRGRCTPLLHRCAVLPSKGGELEGGWDWREEGGRSER